MADPSQAFGPGDPRNAFYAENIAALEHSRGRESGRYQEGLSQHRANATLRQAQYGEAEPGTYKINQERSARGGLSESGVNAKRRGGIAAEYANKRAAVVRGLKEYEEGAGRGYKEGGERNDEARAKAGTKALAEGYEASLKNQGDYSGTYPQMPAQSGGTPGPGGVVPYESQQKGGWVKVGQPLKKWR